MTTTSSTSPSPAPPSPSRRSSSPQQEEKTEQAENSAELTPEGSETGKSPEPNEPVEGSSSTAQPSASTASETPAISWQAIWSPAHNAYYFFNAVTQETTWTNPLQPAAPAAETSATASAEPEEAEVSATNATPASLAQLYAMQAAAEAQGIDPSLAFLDPSLASAGAGPSNPAGYTYTAKFNSRTGTFARPDARDPTHLSEYERMKRMGEVFFDMNQWEQELAQEKDEGEGKKRKRPTKKDLERFKEQKRQKKIAKTAWLRT